MKNTIPTKVVRKIISDILIERGNSIMNATNEMEKEDVRQTGVISQYTSEWGQTSSGTYVLADDILSGYIPVEEALDQILYPSEKVLAEKRCLEWMEQNNSTEIDF